jgi:hypothetical protein
MQATLTRSANESRIVGAQMAKLAVRLINKYGRVLQCEHCGSTWTPEPGPDGSSREGSGVVQTGAIGD